MPRIYAAQRLSAVSFHRAQLLQKDFLSATRLNVGEYELRRDELSIKDTLLNTRVYRVTTKECDELKATIDTALVCDVLDRICRMNKMNLANPANLVNPV